MGRSSLWGELTKALGIQRYKSDMRAPLLALLALIIAPAPALPQTEPFRVLNQTEQSAHSLFAVRTGRPDWGANMLTRPAGAWRRDQYTRGRECRLPL